MRHSRIALFACQTPPSAAACQLWLMSSSLWWSADKILQDLHACLYVKLPGWRFRYCVTLRTYLSPCLCSWMKKTHNEYSELLVKERGDGAWGEPVCERVETNVLMNQMLNEEWTRQDGVVKDMCFNYSSNETWKAIKSPLLIF